MRLLRRSLPLRTSHLRAVGVCCRGRTVKDNTVTCDDPVVQSEEGLGQWPFHWSRLILVSPCALPCTPNSLEWGNRDFLCTHQKVKWVVLSHSEWTRTHCQSQYRAADMYQWKRCIFTLSLCASIADKGEWKTTTNCQLVFDKVRAILVTCILYSAFNELKKVWIFQSIKINSSLSNLLL